MLSALLFAPTIFSEKTTHNLFSVNIHVNATEIIASGDYGNTKDDDVHWKMDSDYTLTFYGTGEMKKVSRQLIDWSDAKKIIIEPGITSIGSYAFMNCTNVVSVELPDTLDIIWYEAFNGCSRLSSVKIPDSVTYIGSGAFESCSSLTSIEIPDLIHDTGVAVFSRCSRLKSVSIGKSLKRLENIFSDCNDLTDITIPETVSFFRGISDCENLKTITFLNPECEFFGSGPSTICNIFNETGAYYSGVIRGYIGSTAQAYAKKNNYTFVPIDDESEITTSFVYGDFDDNGKIDITDLSYLSIQLVDKKAFSEKQEKAADVTGDGHVDLADLAHLRQYLSKKINWLGIESPTI